MSGNGKTHAAESPVSSGFVDCASFSSGSEEFASDEASTSSDDHASPDATEGKESDSAGACAADWAGGADLVGIDGDSSSSTLSRLSNTFASRSMISAAPLPSAS